MSLAARLAEPARYEAEIERLREKHAFSRSLYELQQDDVPLASVCLDRARVARLLADAVSRGAYRLEPARLRRIVTKGKRRLVYAYRLTDAIVGGVVARTLEEMLEPRLADRLYSYRRGRSYWHAITDFAAYVREHRRERPDPRARGLYVIGRDVASYTDTIPVGGGSPLWSMIRELFAEEDGRIRDGDWRIVEAIVRPEVEHANGARTTQLRGIATGQPISCVLFNLYLHDLDHELSAIPGAFYGRYGDDLVFAHPDLDVARSVRDRLEARIRERGLAFEPRKSRDLWLNGAGRADGNGAADFRGAPKVALLGCAVAADGTVSLTREKGRELLRSLETRARRTATVLGGAPVEEKGRIVCSVLNRALDPRTDGTRPGPVSLVRRAVTDRKHLGELDQAIVAMVARTVSGVRGVRAFRSVPPRRVRADWKLVSLVHARNRWART
jgi:hypothetical protein